MTIASPSSRRWEWALGLAFVLALVAYTALAFAVGHWWISGAAAPVVAMLMLARHRRARFSAYVFFSVVVLRSILTGWWILAGGAAAAILLLQTGPARRAWPRIPAPARMAPP